MINKNNIRIQITLSKENYSKLNTMSILVKYGYLKTKSEIINYLIAKEKLLND